MAKQDPRKDNENDHCEPPLEVKEKTDTSRESDQIAENVNNGAREEPAKSLCIVGKSGHQISGLDFIEEGLGKVEDPVKEALLDVERDSLLKAGKGEVFKHLDELFSQDKNDEQSNSARQKPELAFQNDIIHDVPCDERLGESEKGGKENEKKASGRVSPVTEEVRSQVSETIESVSVPLLTCNPVFRRWTRKSLLQIGPPVIQILCPPHVSISLQDYFISPGILLQALSWHQEYEALSRRHENRCSPGMPSKPSPRRKPGSRMDCF